MYKILDNGLGEYIEASIYEAEDKRYPGRGPQEERWSI